MSKKRSLAEASFEDVMKGAAGGNSFEDVMKGTTKKKNSAFQISKTYPAYIILIITIAVSFFIWDFVQDNINESNDRAFEKSTSSVVTRIEKKFDAKLQILQSLKSLFENTFVARDVFELNSKMPIVSFPSIVSISKISKVDSAFYEDFYFNTRSQGYYDVVLYPEGTRQLHYFIEFIHPFEENQNRHGYDLKTDPIFEKTLNNVLDQNTIISTPYYPIRGADTMGFYLIAPVFSKNTDTQTKEQRRENLECALALEINANKFFTEALGTAVATDTSIIFEVYDRLDNKKNKLYNSNNIGNFQSQYDTLISRSVFIKIAGREYEVDFATIPNFGGETQQYLPILAFSGSLLTSFVLFAFVLSVITSRTRALELAEKMTRSQRRIVESSHDIIAVLDFKGNWKSMNPASVELFELVPDEMIGMPFNAQVYEEKDKGFLDKLLSDPTFEFTERTDLMMKTHEGELKWINWSFTVSREDNLIYTIGRDVTLEKQAAEQAKLRNKQIQLAERFAREASETRTYFMTKLSHQLRNSLTGVMGYLQLLSAKVYDNDQEHDQFVEYAEQSSEEIYTFVSDIIDITETGENANKANISTFKFAKLLAGVNDSIKSNLPDIKFNFELMDDSGKTSVVADMSILTETIFNICKVLSADKESIDIQINASENTYENATEIQILGAGNKVVEDMITLYKQDKASIIDALAKDKNDIMLQIAFIESNIRRLNGSMSVDTFGNEEGNVIGITLPLNRR